MVIATTKIDTSAAQDGFVPNVEAILAQKPDAVIQWTHDEKIIPTFKRIYHIRDGVTHEEAGEGRSLEQA